MLVSIFTNAVLAMMSLTHLQVIAVFIVHLDQ